MLVKTGETAQKSALLVFHNRGSLTVFQSFNICNSNIKQRAEKL